MANPLTRFLHWIGEALTHAFGDPRREQEHLPPKIGVQPYKNDPHRP